VQSVGWKGIVSEMIYWFLCQVGCNKVGFSLFSPEAMHLWCFLGCDGGVFLGSQRPGRSHVARTSVYVCRPWSVSRDGRCTLALRKQLAWYAVVFHECIICIILCYQNNCKYLPLTMTVYRKIIIRILWCPNLCWPWKHMEWNFEFIPVIPENRG